MDDFVINVRQIGNYPAAGGVGPTDLILVQQGGLGGPYVAITPADFMGTALDAGGVILFSTGPETGLAWPGGTGIGVNNGVLDFVAPSMAFEGLVNIPSLVIGNSPAASQEWVGEQVTGIYSALAHQVVSFNGRSGNVLLSWQDINTALCLFPGDQVASQNWVNELVCKAIPDFYYSTPLVYTFNGRTGDIQLTLADIENEFFRTPGVYPTAPNPALGDASNRIATTSFVDESLEEWANAINSSWNAADFELLNILQTQYAPLNSPALTGFPTAPTAPIISNDATIATTAFVMRAVTSSVTGVVSFNTRTGAVLFEAQDLTDVGGALLASPNFSGIPTAPQPPASDNSNKIATTSWVLSELAAISAGVTSWNGRSGIVLMQASDITASGGALLASPNFTGAPTAPTQVPGTNNTTLATTAFVLANAGVTSFNSRTGAITLQSNDISAANGALLAGPAFTGVPTAPTAVPGTSTQQLATTAFVMNALGSGGIVSSFNTRTGAITFSAADLASVNGATLSQGTTPPASPTAQSMWYDTTGGQLYIYTGGVWAAVSTAH